MNDMVDVTVNGEPRAVARGATLLELLESLALDPRAVVVEHNRTIVRRPRLAAITVAPGDAIELRSEEHTSELQSQSNLVCRLLLEKKKNTLNRTHDLFLISHTSTSCVLFYPKPAITFACKRVIEMLHLMISSELDVAVRVYVRRVV